MCAHFVVDNAERLSEELIQELCESPEKLRQYAKEQAAKYPPKYNKKTGKRKATTKLESDRHHKVAKWCDLFGMKEKDALDKNLMASAALPPAGSTTTSINGDETSSTTSQRRDVSYSEITSECSTIEMNLRRLCALCKLTHPEMKPVISAKASTIKVAEKGLFDEEYKVSKVIKLEYDKRPVFEVKWEGYEDTTWEPIKNIWDCSAFQAFTDQFIRCRRTDMELLWNELIEKIANESLEPIITDAEAIAQTKRFNYNNFLAHFFMMVRMRRANTSKTSKSYQTVYETILNDMKYLRIYNQRLDQLQNMHEFQRRINLVDQSKNLHVENIVDLEMPPIDEFHYTNDVIPRDGIIIPDDPPVGCSCTDDVEQCSAKSECCPNQFDSDFAYNSRGLIRVKQGTPIFECNKACKCSENCPNRVVQKGRKQTLCIFKTQGRGWGVRTERAIAKGQYICEYVGEIISYEETERRGKEYDAVGRTYLFDLDFNEKDNPYTVDAAKYGNVSRFINHSCDPNLGVWAVWTNCLDLNLPKLCLFTLRPIKENEELTFDYVNSTNSGREHVHENVDDVSMEEDNEFESKKLGVGDTPIIPLSGDTPDEVLVQTEVTEEVFATPSQIEPHEKQDKEVPEAEVRQEVPDVDQEMPVIELDATPEDTDGNDALTTATKTNKKEGFTCRCGAANCRKIIFC